VRDTEKTADAIFRKFLWEVSPTRFFPNTSLILTEIHGTTETYPWQLWNYLTFPCFSVKWSRWTVVQWPERKIKQSKCPTKH